MKTAIVDFSEIRINRIWRLEAEFYSQKSLVGSNCITGEQAIAFVQYGTSEELNEGGHGYPTLRLNEFEGLFIKKPEKYCENISRETYESMRLKKDDVLICRTNGNPKLVGKSALVPKDYDYAFASYLFRVRPKKNFINSATLTIYLNSRIGRSQIEKYLMVNNQANFSPAKFREIQIPQLADFLQETIERIVYIAYRKQESANLYYRDAEQALLSELDLLNWKPKHKLSFVKKLSDTDTAGRIDSEYFQPMYEEIIETMKKYKSGFVKLSEVARTMRGSLISDVFYSENAGIPYIRGADISSGFLGEDKLVYINNSFKPSNETKVEKGDIIFTMIGSVGATALVDERYDKAFISNNLGKVSTKNYNSKVLQILLHSIIGKMYFKRVQTQTAQPKISDKDIHEFILPLLRNEIITKIERLYIGVQNSRALSKYLLDITKRGVEIAIEKNEKDAQKWIDDEIKKLGNKL